MESIKKFVGAGKPKIFEQDDWVYEFNHGREEKPKGPFTLSNLEIKVDSFSGEGNEDSLRKFKFNGQINGKKFTILQEFVDSNHIDVNKRIIGNIMSDGSLVGKWKYLEDLEDSTFVNGEFVIRKIQNFQFTLHEDCPDFLRMKLECMKCKCQRQLMKVLAEETDVYELCSLCAQQFKDLYFSCSNNHLRAQDSQKKCKFMMCNDCYIKVIHIKKSELITKVLNSGDRSNIAENIDYIRGIYRTIFADQTMAQQSIKNREGKDYRWLEVYQLDEETLKFIKKENIELYIDQEKFAEGHFHEVKICKQHRSIKEFFDPYSGRTEYREAVLNPPVNWVFKQIKDAKHIDEVPNDIAKQYLALTFANYFNEMLKRVYPNEEVFLKYVQPFLVLPLFKDQKNLNFFEMESFMETDKLFQYYNRPGEECKVKDNKLGEARLPSAFSHWTYAATDKHFMITDVQGWRLDKGQYVMTDPIVFSNVTDQLGLVDWGTKGMENWMKKHKCNEVCQALPMQRDDVLLEKCLKYLRTFKDDQENFKIQLETILDSFKSR
eukprot:403346223